MRYVKPATTRRSLSLESWAWRHSVTTDANRSLAAVAIGDANPPEGTSLEHRIEIELTHNTSSGARFRVTHLGKTLIESARDPEYEACRALLAKGIKGKMVTYSPGSLVPRMGIDIETGAQFTIIENAKEGPRRARYRPHPGSTEPDDAE
jgi:hypothetical protein